jgi:hypothetical protein
MTYELFSVGDKYIQDLIEALFFPAVDGAQTTQPLAQLKKKTCSAQGRHLLYIFHPFYLFIFLLLLLCGCNSRRFCFRTVMNDLSFLFFLFL